MSIKIIKHSFFYIGCELLARFIPFLMLPYFTRVLSVDEFGNLGLFTAIQLLLLVLFNWSFDGAIARYYYKYGRHNLNNLVLVASILVISFSIAFCMAAWAMNNYILIFLGACSACQSLFNILLSVKQCQKKIYSYTLLQLVFSLLSVLITVLFFNFFYYKAEIRILALAISFLLVYFMGAYTFFRSSKIRFTCILYKRNFLYLIGFGLPLLIHQVSLYAKGQFDRILISHYFSLSTLAYYSAALQVASILSIVITALNKAGVPFLYERMSKNEDSNFIYKIFFVALPLCFIPAILSLFIPGALYGFFLGEKYEEISHFMPGFLLGFGLQLPYLVLVNYMFYKGHNKFIATCTFITGVVHILLLYTLKDYGIYYMTLPLIISNALCIMLLFSFIKWKEKENK